MKSVLQAAWLLTSAFGSVIVMIFSGAHLIQSQVLHTTPCQSIEYDQALKNVNGRHSGLDGGVPKRS